MPTFLGLLNLAAVLALVGFGAERAERLERRESLDATRWRSRALAEGRLRREVEANSAEAVASLAAETTVRIRELEAALRREQDERTTETVAWSQRLAVEVAQREAEARDEVVASLRSDLKSLGDTLDRSLAPRPGFEERFRAIQEAADASIFLIHCEFSYRVKDDDGSTELRTGTGWGTGFAISPDGHIATNKHVVQPWKFDAELAAMVALGQVEILENDARLFAWPAGTRCVDSNGRPDLDLAFNNTTRKNLWLVATAPDRMVRKPIEISNTGLFYPVHELDNNDLVLLRASGAPVRPLPCAKSGEGAPLRKLDRVMALGFPRGHKGLERGIAETSPSLGTVRKVEDTIHITASIIPGNSGGPLFNERGEVVGIATRIYSETLGICLRIDYALDLLATVWRPAEAAKGAAGGSVARIDAAPAAAAPR